MLAMSAHLASRCRFEDPAFARLHDPRANSAHRAPALSLDHWRRPLPVPDCPDVVVRDHAQELVREPVLGRLDRIWAGWLLEHHGLSAHRRLPDRGALDLGPHGICDPVRGLTAEPSAEVARQTRQVRPRTTRTRLQPLTLPAHRPGSDARGVELAE